MKILVTGGAGFIGSHLVDLLIEKGLATAVVDNLSHGKKENVHPKAKFFKADILDPGLLQIFKKFNPHVVSHHAALINVAQSQKDPIKDVSINVSGTLNVLEAARKTKVRQFIFASSVAVYGESEKFPIAEDDALEPISLYGISKLTGEYYVKLYKDHFVPTIFRYANVYGPRQDASAEGGVVAIFCENLKRGKPVTIFGDGEQTRDLVFVKDVVAANFQAILKNQAGTFNISAQKQTSINKLYRLISQLVGTQKKPTYQKPRPGDIRHSLLANQLAKRQLEWLPKWSLSKGLKEMLGLP